GLVRGAEPALQFQITRQRFGFKLAAFATGQSILYTTVASGQGDELGQHVRHLLVPVRRFSLFGQLEPVEAERGQGDEIGQVADRREGRTAGQLDRKSTRLNSSHVKNSYAVF